MDVYIDFYQDKSNIETGIRFFLVGQHAIPMFGRRCVFSTQGPSVVRGKKIVCYS